MNTDLKPLPDSGRCCGETLTLACDFTEYSVVELVNGEWQQTPSHQENLDTEQSVRLFCPDCGDYFQVPGDLP